MGVSNGNLQVHNAQPFDTVNGNGNIVVGKWMKKALTGSHNILVGDPESDSLNQAESYGGIISGSNNKATAKYAVVIGGEGNEAKAPYCAILGAFDSECIGTASTVTGGENNIAQGNFSSVS